MSKICTLLVLSLALCLHALPGGWNDLDEGSETTRDIANFAHSRLQSRSNSLYLTRLHAIRDAQVQIVAGSKYRMTLDLMETTCHRDQDADLSGCEDREHAELQSCTVTVWDRPWLKKRELLSVDCD